MVGIVVYGDLIGVGGVGGFVISVGFFWEVGLRIRFLLDVKLLDLVGGGGIVVLGVGDCGFFLVFIGVVVVGVLVGGIG